MVDDSGVCSDYLVSELERVGEFFDDESDFDVVFSDDFEGEGELERRGNFLAEWVFVFL